MIFIQDFDGWTPLHAAAHWAQREACDVLCDNYANMDIKNYVGQTCFDVADPDVLRLLEELKKKKSVFKIVARRGGGEGEGQWAGENIFSFTLKFS